jgi:hypothetical protein
LHGRLRDSGSPSTEAARSLMVRYGFGCDSSINSAARCGFANDQLPDVFPCVGQILLSAVYAEIPAAYGGGYRVLKLLSEDNANYADAPREGIRRVLEAVTGSAASIWTG